MIKRLLVLNGLAVIGVILNHTAGWGFTAMFWWTDRYLPVTVPNFDQMGSLSYYVLRVFEQLATLSIPSFLFVSGFFVVFATRHNQRTISWNVIGVRIRNLVIPYLIWSIVIITGEYFLQGITYPITHLLMRLVFGGAAPPYYFVPLLCQLYIFSPFLVPMARNNWKLLLILAVVVQLIAVGAQYVDILGVDIPVLNLVVKLTPGWFFPRNIFWFTFGILAGFNLQYLKHRVVKIKWGLLVVVCLLFFMGVLEWEVLLRLSGQEWVASRETVLDNLFAGAFLLSFLAFDQVTLPYSKKIGKLGTKSFGIYLVHSPVLEYAAKVVFHITPWFLAVQVLFQPMLIVLGLAVPLFLMVLVKRSPVHRAYIYLFG